MCVEKRASLYLPDRAEVLKRFGQRLRDLNELRCPACKTPWVVERTGSEPESSVRVYRSTGVKPSIAGGWAYSASAPQGEGSSYRILLTLDLRGDEITGELAAWGFNEHDPEGTRSGRIGHVRGEWLGEYAWLTIAGAKIGLEGGATALFFAKPFELLDEQDQVAGQLLVSRYEEGIQRNRGTERWRRPGLYDARPDWLERAP